ncbi:UNVERIFIED_ORG: hypothetical protein BCL66_1315 [Martelella mediterranea]
MLSLIPMERPPMTEEYERHNKNAAVNVYFAVPSISA